MDLAGTPNIPTLAMLLPIAAGVILMLVGTRHAAFAGSMVTGLLQFGVLIWGWAVLDGHVTADSTFAAAVQRQNVWLEQVGVNLTLNFDHAALGLSLMATAVVFGAAVFAWIADRPRPGLYHGLLWMTLGAVVGLLVARDVIVFYIFFELMLIPVYFLVGVWGGPDRMRATATMFIYTVAGSLLMLIGLLGLGAAAGSFSMDEISLAVAADPGIVNDWMFFAVLAAIFVKAPLVPFHAWQPLAYREAPGEVTAVLSGVVSKAAMFTGLAVLIPLFPEQVARWDALLISIAVVTLLYGSITAFRQPDLRGVLTYSSLAQMGLIMLGLFVAAGDGVREGMAGSYLQAVNHGLVSGALFLLAAAIELRAGTGQLDRLGGAAGGRPILATVAIILALVALAVPGSNVFAGELLVLLGAWSFHWAWGVAAGFAIVLAAMYVLRLLSAVMHADTDDGADGPDIGRDLTGPEALMLAPLLAGIALLTIVPNVARDSMNIAPVQRAAVTAANAPATGASVQTIDAGAPAP